jgi:hypothetical protein
MTKATVFQHLLSLAFPALTRWFGPTGKFSSKETLRLFSDQILPIPLHGMNIVFGITGDK